MTQKTIQRKSFNWFTDLQRFFEKYQHTLINIQIVEGIEGKEFLAFYYEA